jgi:glutamate carboxypeptidase
MRGALEGGTAPNAVPDYAKVLIDVRFPDEDLIPIIKEQLKTIADKIFVRDTKSTVSYIGDSNGIQYYPMRKTYSNMKLFEYVSLIADELGYNNPSIKPIVSGGGSDSAHSVIAGIPTIDQFGVKGEWNHSPREYALVSSIFERIKLAIACVIKIEEFSLL